MVDFIVVNKIFDGKDLFNNNGSNNELHGKSNAGTRPSVNSTSNAEEETNPIEEKTKYRTGVFVGRTQKEKIEDVNSHLRWTVNSSRFGKFGHGRRRTTDGKNCTFTDNEFGRGNDEKLKTRHRKLRDISKFFGGIVSTQQAGLRGLRTVDSVYNTPVSFAAVEDGIRTRTLGSPNAESEKMEIHSSIDSATATSGVHNVFGKFGNGRERLVGMDEDAKITMADYSVELRKIARETFVKFLGSTCRYISDICVPENGEEIVQFLADVRQLSGLSSTEQLRLVSVHDTHIHVVHSCAYSNCTCRCSWLSGSTIWRNRRIARHRRRVFLADITVDQWEDIYRYFITNGHSVKNIESGGANARLCIRLKNLQERGYSDIGQESMVHKGTYESCRNVDGGTPHQTEIGFGDSRSIGGHQGEKEHANGEGVRVWPKTLDELLVKYPCCPPDAFFNIKEFYNNPNLNHLDDNCKKVRVALRNWCARIREWSINEFHDFYASGQIHPYFNAYSRDKKQVYYDVKTSVQIAEELLCYQFDNDGDLISKFLYDVYAIVDKLIPKRNSMCIVSPPSAGKNFFFDAIASYFLNYGMFGTANKTNNFSWADGAGKRIVLWNEPNYETYHVEKIKELLGGDTTRIHVKYKGDQPLQGPPIFLLTNNSLNICNDPAFADRLVTYQWKSAPFLKNYNRKLNPLFFYDLLTKWIDINEKTIV